MLQFGATQLQNGYWWEVYPVAGVFILVVVCDQLHRRRAARRLRGSPARALGAVGEGPVVAWCRAVRLAPIVDGRAQRKVAGGAWCAAEARNSGSSFAQISWARGHRVRKRQPDGGCTDEGSSPMTGRPLRVAPLLGRERAPRRAGPGCRGARAFERLTRRRRSRRSCPGTSRAMVSAM